MNARRMVIMAAAALLPAALHAAGNTALSSYFSQIPPVPRNVEEAYKASIVDDAKVMQGALVEIGRPKAFADLEAKLSAEGVAGAQFNPAAAGANPAAIAQMQGMSPAAQQAAAQQMAAQAGAQTAGTFSAAERPVVVLMEQRQQSLMSRIQIDMQAQTEWAQTQERFDEEHRALNQKEEAERAKAQYNTCQADQAARRRWADEHVKLMNDQLMAGLAAYDKRRVIATDFAGFADRMAVHEKKMTSMVTKAGYADARVQAVQQVGYLAAISANLYDRAAYWEMLRRSLIKNQCES